MLSSISLRKESVDLNSSGIVPPVIADYLNNSLKLNDLISYRPEIDSFADAINDRSEFPFHRPELVSALLRQNTHFLEDNELNDAIHSLSDSSTYTVVTGHQLCIFTGPLYFIYKIISVLNLAEALNRKYPGKRIVPVYWMASEDHDFEEISSFNIYNHQLKWNYDAKGPVGRLPTDSMHSVLTELKAVMGEGAHADELFRIFEEAYLFNANLADATRFLIYRLFPESGLVIIDGDDVALKRLFIPIMKAELLEGRSSGILKSVNNRLEKAGYKPQVQPREINLFYIQDNLRERIIKDGGVFHVVNTQLKFTEPEIIDLLDRHPEYFSPNVVIRPLYEEYILPNLAYVGGPGELSYWLQYRDVFSAFNVHFPVLMPRNTVLLLDENMEKKMNALGLAPSDLFMLPDDLVKEYIRKQAGSDIDFNDEEAALISVFNSVRDKAVKVDPTLEGPVGAEQQKTINSLHQLVKKVNASVKRRHETSVTQIKTLKERAFPKNVFQERHVNFIPYYIKYGSGFIETLKNELESSGKKVIVLTLG